MASYNPGIKADIAASYINSRFAEQKWYQENANFITSAAGLVATVLAWLVTQPIAEDPKVQMGILVAGFICTTLGVKVTRNGFSKSQVAKVNNVVAQNVDATPLIPVVEEPDEEGPEDDDDDEDAAAALAAQVEEFNRARET